MAEGYYYPEEIIEEVIGRNDIVDVVSDYVKIKRKGKDYFGLCPFHSEKTPSFSVVPAKQIFYCFGCGKGGNAATFIKNIENIDYIDSIKFLADRVAMVLPESNNPGELKKQQKMKRLLAINNETAKYYYQQLKTPESMEARQYFKLRGVSVETIKRFGLGYAPNQWNLLTSHLLSKGFKERDMVDAGVILRSEKGSYYDRFRNRIIFPIIDIRNRVIAFGGRRLREDGPKYLNSPETLIFNKRRHLYGMNIAKNTKNSFLILVEGYMDCISLQQAGIDYVVATLGTALTSMQAKLLKKNTSEVIIAYDSDTAGQKATIRGLDLLAKMSCNVKVLQLQEYKDPDEYMKEKGEKQFLKQVDEALPLVEYKALLLGEQYNIETDDGRIKFLNGVAKAISQVSNAMEREIYIKRISMKYEISENSLQIEVKKQSGEMTAEEAEKEKTLNVKLVKSNNMLDQDFLSIVAIICEENSLFTHMQQLGKMGFLSSEKHVKLFQEISNRVNNEKRIDETSISLIMDEEDAALFAGLATSLETSNDLRKTLTEKINRYKMTIAKKNIDELTHRITNENLDEQIVVTLQQQLLSHMNTLRILKKQ